MVGVLSFTRTYLGIIDLILLIPFKIGYNSWICEFISLILENPFSLNFHYLYFILLGLQLDAQYTYAFYLKLFHTVHIFTSLQIFG